MKYSQEQLNELSEKIDIVDYIGQTEELHRKGQLYYCCCPFHSGDNTPSLCIYPDTQTWYCYGCGAGSSIYDWIMHKDNISFQEAVIKISSLTNSPLEETIESESISVLKTLRKQKESHIKEVNQRRILDWQLDYYNKYDDECPQEWLDEDMTREALKTYNIRIDHSANRIVYPVEDKDGNLIGVKGRTRLSAYKELGLSKYMNYYKIGQLDYFAGWSQALSEIKQTKSVIIFEGLKSCIKSYGWGIRNTIASETAALSEGQLRLLIQSGISDITIAWDSDQKFQDIVRDSKIQRLKMFANVYVIKDIHGLLDNKMAPVDKGEKIYKKLLEERIKI